MNPNIRRQEPTPRGVQEGFRKETMELDLLGRQRRGSCDRSSPAPGRGSGEDGPVGLEREDEAGAGDEVVKGRWVQAARPRAWGLCAQGDWEAQTLIALLLESALDDLDLNEFGVAALEKTFDSSTVPHPGSITIGTGLQWAGWWEGSGGLSGPGWVDGAVPYLAWPRTASLLTWPFPASLAGGSLLQSSAPVNIPGSLGSSASFHSASPSPPVSLSSHFLQQPQGHLSQSENTFLGTSASHGSLGKKWRTETWDRNWALGMCLWPLRPGLETVQRGG